MSRRRYVSTAISLDAALNRLAIEQGDFAALLYTWMIPHAGDDGLIHGTAEEILYLVMPGRRDKGPAEIDAALRAMHELGLVIWNPSEHTAGFPLEPFYKYQSYIKGKAKRVSWNRIRSIMRPRILERDGYRCRQCGSTDRLEVDHIIPIARGGGSDEDNLQTLCRPCNRRKWAH